jgi:hypothetical protein
VVGFASYHRDEQGPHPFTHSSDPEWPDSDSGGLVRRSLLRQSFSLLTRSYCSQLRLTCSFSPVCGKRSYRNPCNIPGSGKQNANTCGALSVPGLFQCVYCAGSTDPRLRGQGMGCQLSTLEWAVPAECRPVNSKSVPASSIWQVRSNTRCQCTDTQYLCNNTLSSVRGADWERRFPG